MASQFRACVAASMDCTSFVRPCQVVFSPCGAPQSFPSSRSNLSCSTSSHLLGHPSAKTALTSRSKLSEVAAPLILPPSPFVDHRSRCCRRNVVAWENYSEVSSSARSCALKTTATLAPCIDRGCMRHDEVQLSTESGYLFCPVFEPSQVLLASPLTQLDGQEADCDVLTSLTAALQSTTAPRQQKESEDKGDYYVNVGYAIRTLRDELPSMFYKPMSFNIYRDDITFRDPLNTFSGIDSYKLIFWALRFHGRIFFKALWVDVLRVWQPSDKVIVLRWSVRGIPRVPWETQGHFEGTSEYKLDKEGKIYEHKVDNVSLNTPQKFTPVTVMDLVRLTPTATPFLNSCMASHTNVAANLAEKDR